MEKESLNRGGDKPQLQVKWRSHVDGNNELKQVGQVEAEVIRKSVKHVINASGT